MRKIVSALTVTLYLALNAVAQDVPAPVTLPSFQLPKKFARATFPSYLQPALGAFVSGDNAACSKRLSDVKISNYSDQPEKYYLLRAACYAGEGKKDEAITAIETAVVQKGSRSDVLYLLGLVANNAAAAEVATKRLEESLWFDSFKTFSKPEALAALGTIEIALGNADQGKTHLDAANSGIAPNLEVKLLLAQLAVESGDRRGAITKARDAVIQGGGQPAEELLLRALSNGADPVLHKRDIGEAAALAEKLPKTAFAHTATAYAAVRALLLAGKQREAESTLRAALKANPGDPKLLDLDSQLKNEKQTEKETAQSASNG